MQVHQFSVTYVQEQDRILIRINTTTGEEMRVWFTRRLMLPLWPNLNKVVAEHVARDKGAQGNVQSPLAHSDDLTKRMMADFERQESLGKSDFKTPYNARPSLLPLGDDPLVVTQISMTPVDKGALRLSFEEKLPGQTNPRAFQVTLAMQTLHGLVHLLEQALNRSEWLPDGAPAAAAPAPVPPPERPRYLN